MNSYAQTFPMHGLQLERLRIESIWEAPRVRQILVEYRYGGRQFLGNVGQLSLGRGQVFDLRRGPIRQIVVYTDPRSYGAYMIVGGVRRPDTFSDRFGGGHRFMDVE